MGLNEQSIFKVYIKLPQARNIARKIRKKLNMNLFSI